ncbi:MAG TPA: hypothetical protein VFB82_23170 [Blastocatellia bacterium]|nr:hypothetical protein [Blastocatellia bacterium]
MNSEVEGAFSYDQQTGWMISFQDEDRHARVIDAVAQFSCITMDLRAEPQGSLFDY